MKTFLKIDYWAQTILLGIMGITVPTILGPLYLLIVFGGWQLLSGFLTGLFFRKLDRKAYLPKSLAYVFFLYLASTWEALIPFLDELGFLYFLLFLLIIPMIIGVWYYKMVSKDYHHYCKPKVIQPNTMEMNSPFVKEKIETIATN